MKARTAARRAIDRLIDLLPIPALVAAAAFFAGAWLVKLLRGYPSYAHVATDRYFQCFSIASLALLLIYFILSRGEPFKANERGILVAAFDGDTNGNVHRHTTETLRDELRKTSSPSDARLAEVSSSLSDETAVDLLNERQATGIVAGSVISDKLVWYRMYWRNQPPIQMSVRP